MPLTARVICARLVRESPLFFARSLLPPLGMRSYHLRDSTLRVAIRHRGADPATLAEVFYDRWYEPPAEVELAIGDPRTILDLGANIGLFGVFAISRWPSSQITGYEPDPANAAVCERTIALNGLGGRWSVIAAAAGAHEREVSFAAGLGASSHLLDPGGEAPAGSLVVAQHDVMSAIATVDITKIDIEGGEWEILGDPRFAASPPRVLVMEYHPERCPERDPRAAAERLLTGAGLVTASIWHGDDGVGMLWAWRP
jgi:FkbM family methyltransferase